MEIQDSPVDGKSLPRLCKRTGTFKLEIHMISHHSSGGRFLGCAEGCLSAVLKDLQEVLQCSLRLIEMLMDAGMTTGHVQFSYNAQH